MDFLRFFQSKVVRPSKGHLLLQHCLAEKDLFRVVLRRAVQERGKKRRFRLGFGLCKIEEGKSEWYRSDDEERGEDGYLREAMNGV